MSSPPRISVVMPSFNQARYLGDAIESVLSQGAHLHELIVLDGGSTDGSLDVIKKYEHSLSYWRSEKDDGQSAAIHEGFERASGDILCWLNSDDLFVSGAFDRVAKTLLAHPDADVISGFLYYIDENGAISECPQVLTGSPALARLGVVNVNQQSTFFKKDFYQRVGGIDSSLHCAMDMDLWCRFYANAARWVPIPYYLAAFRKHSAAKGGGGPWWDRYQVEKATVRSRFPQLYGSPASQALGLACYRFVQVVSGRHLRGIQKTHRLAGKPFVEVGRL